MTLQQLKYVVAIDRHRNFARAAEELDVTQPTLSGMLSKLEEELDVRIFERTNRVVLPTAIGSRIITQARRVIAEAERIGEIVAEEKGSVSGRLVLSVSQAIAPYVLPRFIKLYSADYPQVDLTIEEMKADVMIEALKRGTIDVGIAVSGNCCDGVYEIPLYTEKFHVYLSDSCSRRLPVFMPENLEHENMWVMRDAQCLRESAFSFCKGRSRGRHVYEAGNIETLIRIVDENGGYTIIPEMHLPLLSDSQRSNVRPIDGNHLSCRRVALYIRADFIREHLLNTIPATLLRFMPRSMFDDRIVRHGIRL